MGSWRTFLASLALVVVAAALAGANPLSSCEWAWEYGYTVLGFDGTGLVATIEMSPEPDEWGNSLRLDLVAPSDPLPAAQIVWTWNGGDHPRVIFMYYLAEPGTAQWRLEARWNDSLPEDPQADDGDAGGVDLAGAAGWNWLEHEFPSSSEHDGLVITITPLVPDPGAIWIDGLVVDGHTMTIRTPCEEYVGTRGRLLGEIKALFE